MTRKMMKKLNVVVTLALALGCGTGVLADEGVVKIPIIVTTGANDSMDIQLKAMVEDFNEEYKDTYQLDVEWLAGSSEDYRSKLKMLNASNSLPALIQTGAEPAFYDLLVENDRLIDIMPYLEADEDWQSKVMPQSVEAFTNENGEMFRAPINGVQMGGIYYNKELFAQAGIEKFPETWDEFWETCDKLKEAGIAALSLHTTETAWCPMLVATAYLGSTEAGREFLDVQFPDSYNTPEFQDAVEVLKKQFDYTTADALGGTYALAANNFFSGNTAMIANGPWMMSSLNDPDYAPEGFADKVGYAKYPGDIMIASMEQGCWSVTADYDQDVVDGAVEFIKFMSRTEYTTKRAIESGEMSSVVEFPEEEYDKLMAPMKDCVDISGNVETVLPSYQTKWDPITQNDVFGREITNLVSGSITVEEFIQMMDDGAAQYKQDLE